MFTLPVFALYGCTIAWSRGLTRVTALPRPTRSASASYSADRAHRLVCCPDPAGETHARSLKPTHTCTLAPQVCRASVRRRVANPTHTCSAALHALSPSPPGCTWLRLGGLNPPSPGSIHRPADSDRLRPFPSRATGFTVPAPPSHQNQPLEPGLRELNPAPSRCGVWKWGAPNSAVKVAARCQNIPTEPACDVKTYRLNPHVNT